MRWLNALWQLVRDVALTGAGLWIIVMQASTSKPSDALIVAGLALTVPSATSHAVQILGAGSVQPPSSPSSPPSGSPASPSSPEDGGPSQEQRQPVSQGSPDGG